MIICVTGVLRRTVVGDWRFDNQLAQVVKTLVANNIPSQDSGHPDDHFFNQGMLLLGSNHFLI